MREEEGLSARTVIQAKKEWTGCVPRWAGANRTHATLSGTVGAGCRVVAKLGLGLQKLACGHESWRHGD